MLVALPAFGGHPEVGLGVSNFEIDTDANTVQDDADPAIDWLTANTTTPPLVVPDKESGQQDDSFGQGAKEDTEVPTVVDGSIPPNKSDLLEFGVYQEDAGTAGVLNLFWSRVQDPSGTTNMDFEFNKNKCVIDEGTGQPTDDSNCSGNGVTPVRTAGDLLIVYELSKGGTVPELFLLEWLDGTETPAATAADCDSSNSLPCWGNRIDLDASGDAAGSINTTAVPAGTTVGGDDLGPYSPRTFGEAQIDLDAIFDEGACESFGSAYLKSRSSDSFTAALKDFIAPEPVDINNCGQVIIRKQTDPDGAAGSFDFAKTFGTDPATSDTFSLSDDGVQDYGKTVLFGEAYTVTETALADGFELIDIDCSASSNVTPTIDPENNKVTFDLDSDDDVLDCTFTNRIRGQVNILKVDDADPPATLEGVTFELFTDNPPLDGDPPAGAEDTATGQTCTTAADGTCSITDVIPGQYWVVEDVSTLPAGYDPAPDQNIVIDGSSLTVDLTFIDPRQTGAILITKTRKHAAAGSDTDPHAGVDFTVTGGELAAEGIAATTDENGEACVDGLVLSDFVGDYTVTESVPTGYAADGDAAKTVSVTTKSTCGDGSEDSVDFANTPLTDVTVSVDSLVDGGTASTIVCTDSAGNVSDKATEANGDGSLTVEDLLPTDPTVTLTCEITVDP